MLAARENSAQAEKPAHPTGPPSPTGKAGTKTPLGVIILLTAGALAIHGYHFAADDSGIYLAAVNKIIDPSLYPFGDEFFLSHDRLSVFALLLGKTARLTHLPVEAMVFAWHIASIFVFLLAAWNLLDLLFESKLARWSGLLTITTTLTVPVAGTALVIMDPYLTARSASTPLTMLAVAAVLRDKRWMAGFWIVLAALAHPQMALYGFIFLILLSYSRGRIDQGMGTHDVLAARVAVLGASPGGFRLGPAAPDYHMVLEMRPFLDLRLWRWWEWIGVMSPLGFFAWSSRVEIRGASTLYSVVARAAFIFGLLSTCVGLLISSGPRFENLLRLQPMRCFHLIYTLFFLMLGGLLGEYLLRERRWLWIAVFSSVAIAIFLAQRNAYAYSPHVEWPGAPPRNNWVSAFLWIRQNAPKDAIFALDPGYILARGEDEHGFRAIAQRSMLADEVKDSGVVSLFPPLAQEWYREQQALSGWKSFQLKDFQRLAREYPVSWVVVEGAPAAGLDCRYHNPAVSVCRIPHAPGLR